MLSVTNRSPGAVLSATAVSRGTVPRFARLIYPLAWATPMAAWQTLFFVVPLGFLIVLTFWKVENYRLVAALDPVNWIAVYGTPYFWSVYLRTCAMAAGAAALISLIAFPCAYFLAFHLDKGARRLAVLLLITPFFTSYLVRVYTWQAFLGDNGLINAALQGAGREPVAMLNTVFGTFVGYATLCLPLVVLLQFMSLVNIDRSLIEAARNLRCPPWRTVWAVIVPSARVGLVLGATFAFILTFGDFVSPTYLGGGNPPTLGILITDFTKAGNQWPRAAVVAVTMVTTLILVAFFAVRFAYKTRRRSHG